MMGEEVVVKRLPRCDFCHVNGRLSRARYDGRTTQGYWANMCEFHFKKYGTGLGTGKGQRLVLSGEANG